MSDTDLLPPLFYGAYFFGRHLVNLVGLALAIHRRSQHESSVVTYQRWVDFYTLVVGSANILLFLAIILFGQFSELWGLFVFAVIAGLTTWFFQRPVAIQVAGFLDTLGKISDSKQLIAHIRKTQPRVFVPVYYMRY